MVLKYKISIIALVQISLSEQQVGHQSHCESKWVRVLQRKPFFAALMPSGESTSDIMDPGVWVDYEK